MELEEAKTIAEEVVGLLQPACSCTEVVGSVRRKRPFVNDIDILLIPRDPWTLKQRIWQFAADKVILNGPKLARFIYKGAQVDLYYADGKTWGTLLLIRTGSKESNIRLTSAAKRRGWKLRASGEGLFDNAGQRIAGDSEESIFRALGLPYLEPEERR